MVNRFWFSSLSVGLGSGSGESRLVEAIAAVVVLVVCERMSVYLRSEIREGLVVVSPVLDNAGPEVAKLMVLENHRVN